jgi:putative Mg2+ transporter-C (MgtC) family protein
MELGLSPVYALGHMASFWNTLTSSIQTEIFLRMVLAVVLGGLIGLEREHRSRPAGLRTMIMVCLGATIIMIVSAELPSQFYSGPGETVIRVDPGRIAAGIVTGIGFLGAGVVLKLGDIVRGVTTAACIWFVAALGIAIGEGHYVLSVSATLLALLVLWAFHHVELMFRSGVYRNITVRVEAGRSGDVLGEVWNILKKAGATILDLRTSEQKDEGETSIRIYIKIKQEFQSHDLVKRTITLEGVRSVKWEGSQ